MLEAELYRRLALGAVGRRITSVDVCDPMAPRTAGAARSAVRLRGRTVLGAGRVGKLVILQTDGGELVLHFGMTGRLLLDGRAAIDRLAYGGTRDDPSWDRLVVRLAPGGTAARAGALVLRDPRRLGGFDVDPDLGHLGPDAWGVEVGALGGALVGARAALKARLLDQHRIAGLGNLLVDELLWRAALDPTQPAGALAPGDHRHLQQTLGEMLPELLDRGGSHTGDLVAHRHPGGRCPRDGTALVRSTVGGRTTWWCPAHQRRA